MARPRRSGDKRERLLEEGVASLLRHGYHGTGIQQVLDRVSVLAADDHLGALGLGQLQHDVEGELDQEVRSKIKNLQEGTATFEIEYQRAMDELKRKKRLT